MVASGVAAAGRPWLEGDSGACCMWRRRTAVMHPLLVAQLALALACAVASASGDVEERLIGWKGDTYNAVNDNKLEQEQAQLQQQALNAAEGLPGSGAEPERTQWIETISWQPRAFIYHGFLSKQECDHLVDLGSKRVSRSMVVDAKTGGSKLDNIRTSFGGAFARGEDPLIAEVEERIAEWTHLPPDYGEPMQILRYVDGQQYAAHWDYFLDEFHESKKNSDGNRYATVLLYLSEVDEGGETTLPLAEPLDRERQKLVAPSECAAKMGMAVRPRKGDALLFFDMNVLGTKQDRRSLHASCPTLRGTKWTATKWIHNKQIMGNFDALARAGSCKDTAWDCGAKASKGLCDADPTLIGLAGTCRATCKDCTPCPEGDLLCYRRNMRSQRAAQRQAAASHSGATSQPL